LTHFFACCGATLIHFTHRRVTWEISAMPAWIPEVNHIFAKALEIAASEERQAFLQQACHGNVELRFRVDAMLAAHESAGSFLESPAAEINATAADSASEAHGGHIGPYELLQQLGEGGMGRVWVAEQQDPVHRRVALKVIKAGMDSAYVIARFEQERQALAMMDHPNIAKVLDAGATSEGRPYFVMELVKGVPLTQYCDEEHLTPSERLELFIPVCQAVQHAHQKGVIHRDLKPSNVLIALYDGKPVPKVIDFGVAKATAQRLTDRTVFTEVGQIVGTLEYMAPEQAELNNLDIDTRADIYSLGVILYELLTGSPPLTAKEMRGAAFTEMLRIIREVEPPKPSTKLSSSKELPAIAANRKLEPARLAKLVHGELDWIVMKALEKDRNRRYVTANSFAMDLQRYLSHEPVQACPPAAAYRLRKFVQRNRLSVMAVAGVILALVVGILGTSTGLLRALAAEKLAGDRLQRAEQAELQATNERNAAMTAETKATREAAIARAVTSFLQTDLLEMADPAFQVRDEFPVDPDVKLRTLVDRAERRVEERFRGQPEVEAAIRRTLASVFAGVGHFARAAEQFSKVRALQEETLGTDHPDTLMTLLSLAETLDSSGRREEALPLAEKAFQLLKSKVGEDDQRTLRAMSNLGATYMNVGRTAEALTVLREAHRRMCSKIGEDDPFTLNCLGTIALLSLKESLTPLEEVVRLQKVKLGLKDRNTMSSMYWLANAYLISGRVAEGVSLCEHVLKLDKEVYGADHPQTACSMRLLGKAFVKTDRLPEAMPLLEEALRLHRAKPGPKHSITLDSLDALAQGHLAAKHPEKAASLFKESLAILEQAEPNGWRTQITKLKLGTALVSQKKYAEAEPLLREGYEGMERREAMIPPPVKVRLTEALDRLVRLYEANGQKDQADKWRQKLAEQKKKESELRRQDPEVKSPKAKRKPKSA
jgi:serine/threonine protein kinase/tetratricopeptide (TPR) repeat protein